MSWINIGDKIMEKTYSVTAFDLLSDCKYEEALSCEEKEMTKHTLELLKKMLIFGVVLSEHSDFSKDCCYQTAVQWEKEYQELKKIYGEVYLVPEEKENKNAQSAEVVIQPSKVMKLSPREYINGGRARYNVMREFER